MTEHQKARRARKSAAFFAKRAEAAAAEGNRAEARRLAEWAGRKVAEHAKARDANVAPPVFPQFHQRLMRALDAATYAGGNLTPAHSAIRRAIREANMRGTQFQTPAQLVAAVRAFSPWLASKVEEAAHAAAA